MELIGRKLRTTRSETGKGTRFVASDAKHVLAATQTKRTASVATENVMPTGSER